MSASSAGSSTLSPTKGSRPDRPLDNDHVEELLARLPKRAREHVEVVSESEIEVVSISNRVSKRPRALMSSTSASLSTSVRTTRHTQSEAEEAEIADTGTSTAALRDLAYRLKILGEGRQRPRPRDLPTPDELQGRRDFPDGFPVRDSLYATDLRPGPLIHALPIHKCACCVKVKSCPVCGRQVRRERVRSKRKVAKNHISRVALPDLLEDWACASLRQTYEVFKAARDLDGDFDETEFAHWISPPPFDAPAIALANEPDDADYQDWLACLVDGCLLRRERAFEAGLKEDLAHIGKKKMGDRLRTDIKSLLAHDWVALRTKEALYQPGTPPHTMLNCSDYCSDSRTTRIHHHHQIALAPDTHPPCRRPHATPAFFSRFFSSPPTNDDIWRFQDLQHDSELPDGQIRSFVNAHTAKHWQITFAGRIVADVQEPDARYLILEALSGEQMLEDFKEMVWALGRLKDRALRKTLAKSVDDWTRPGRNGMDSGYIYVHITSKTVLTTHAWERDEPWVAEPERLPVNPLAVGAAVFCVAHLLQIDNQLHDEPPLFAKWIVKCRFLSRLHLPSAGAQGRNPGMLVFLSRGGVPGGLPVSASEQLAVRDDSDEADE
ncbi:hypothetical protein C8F01DRAFT_1256371 [Mycena amicta]|nr:hypothetical protein C8F01DRAFT_1260739 [Mycena amicta]KAJ7057752.1 hypothetical protein C8F01DRAFT_1256371 [Mycena amicta]